VGDEKLAEVAESLVREISKDESIGS